MGERLDPLTEEIGKAEQLDLPVRPAMRKTPMFTASNALRYQRQDIIKETNKKQNTDLICYIGGANTEIDRNDVIGFVDMLHNIPDGHPIDCMLHTCGGDVDACEKLVKLLRAKVGSSPLRMIIPDMAKSAGTLMALGGTAILMSDTSELGMIDPQFPMKDSRGNDFMHSVMEYLEAYGGYTQALRNDPKDPVALLMLDSFDPKIVRKFQGIRDRVQFFAEDLLKRRGLNYTSIASELLSSKTWKTHGQPIQYADAKQIGLPIEYISPLDEQWETYWKLYCLQRLEIGEDKKIFESSFVSQVF